MVLAEWEALSKIVNGTLTAVAVIAAGLWAYFKFARGRVFAKRAEVQLVVHPWRSPAARQTLKVVVTVRNTGASSIHLEPGAVFVETFAIAAADWPDSTNLVWNEPLLLTKIFSDHGGLESSETITDSVLVPLPNPATNDGHWVAFRVVVSVVGTRPRLRSTSTRWTAATTLLADEVAPHRTTTQQVA